MMVSTLAFTINDTFMKGVSGTLPMFQSVLLRGLLATALIAGIAFAQGQLRPPRSGRDRRLVALRCVGEVGATICFLTALFNMPIANASAILQSVPLVITLTAALIFREPVGWRRYTAIGIGFLGVLIIVRPGSDGFTVYSLWALGSIGFIALRDLSTRRLSDETPLLGLVVATSAAITLAAGLGTMAAGWTPTGPREMAALGAAAVSLLVGYFAGVLSMRLGEIGFVQPFRYSLLLWAMVMGVFVFGEWPDLWMLLGSAIVVGTGIYTLHRERLALRRASQGTAPAAG